MAVGLYLDVHVDHAIAAQLRLRYSMSSPPRKTARIRWRMIDYSNALANLAVRW